jgi:membrane protease YdiL (CAAX protease family)
MGDRNMLPTLPNTPPHSRVWRMIHYPLVLLVLGIITVAAAAFLSATIRPFFPIERNGPLAILFSCIAAGIFMGAYALFVRWIERRPVDELGTRNWAGELAWGLLAGLLLFSVVIGIIALLGGYRVIGSNPPSALYPAVAIAITSGVTEEIVLRGLFFRLIERLAGSWMALALSAALFGALHLANPHATLFAGFAIALEAGVMLAAVYMVTRRLWAAIGLHAAWNLAQGGIYGVAVSGFDMGGLLRPRIVGPDLLTGGTFGAEASLPAIIVCTTFGIALLVVARRRGRIVQPSWVRRRDQRAALQE